MKKLWLLSLFLVGLFLYWCWESTENINTDKAENEDKVTENTISESEVFENNLKCQDYKDAFIKRSEHVASPLEPIWVTIFYSPVKNTCIWYFSTKYDSSKEWYIWNDYVYDREFFVVNAFDDSAEWSIYRYWVNNVYNVTWCDWVSWFWYDTWILKSECKNEEDVEKLWWDEINYLKWN